MAHKQPPASSPSRNTRPVGAKRLAWAVVTALVTLAVAGVYLGLYRVRGFALPVGFDAPWYVWRATFVQARGIGPLGTSSRPGSAVLAAILGSITGRVGYTWGPGLLYVKGGYAYSDNNENATLGGVPIAFATSDDHRNGYTIAAGVEYMFAPNWSAKAEYQYYNFGSANFTAPAALVPTGNFTTDDHVVKAGVDYRFNWANPVVGRY